MNVPNKNEEKKLNKDFVKSGISSAAIAGIILISILLFSLSVFLVKKFDIKTMQEQDEALQPATETIAEPEMYMFEFSNEKEFYQKKWFIHDGIVYVKCPGLMIPDTSCLGKPIGKTSMDIQYSEYVVKIRDGAKNMLSSGQEYFEYPEDSRFLILKNGNDGNASYQAFVNEDFYHFFCFDDDFQILIDNFSIVNSVSLHRYTNAKNPDTVNMSLDDYSCLISHMELQDDISMVSTSEGYTVQTTVDLTLNNGLIYSYIVALHKTEEHPLFWYRDIQGANSTQAFSYAWGENEDYDEKILNLFWPDNPDSSEQNKTNYFE